MSCASGTTDLLNVGRLKTPITHVAGEEVDMSLFDPAHRLRLESRRDWLVLAVVFDRIMFVVFMITTIVCMGFYFPFPTSLSEIFGDISNFNVSTTVPSGY